MKNKVLIGNCFSLTLIRGCDVLVQSRAVREIHDIVMDGAEVFSFWGHENTRVEAEKVVGFSLKPNSSRPALMLSPDGLPMLDGDAFDTCWVLSPDYVPGYRPPIAVEVDGDKIIGWRLLKLTWRINVRKEIADGE